MKSRFGGARPRWRASLQLVANPGVAASLASTLEELAACDLDGPAPAGQRRGLGLAALADGLQPAIERLEAAERRLTAEFRALVAGRYGAAARAELAPVI